MDHQTELKIEDYVNFHWPDPKRMERTFCKNDVEFGYSLLESDLRAAKEEILEFSTNKDGIVNLLNRHGAHCDNG